MDLTDHDKREAYAQYLDAYALTASGGHVEYADGTGGDVADAAGVRYDPDQQLAVCFARALGAHNAADRTRPSDWPEFVRNLCHGVLMVPPKVEAE